MEKTYFRSGLGLKAEVKPRIDSEYQSGLLELIRSGGYTHTFGDLTVRLAQEFGFCYGVERAVEYAYETRMKFPDRKIFLMGEIIHNPHVNHRLQEMGIEFIRPEMSGDFSFDAVLPEHVVIIPAFGVTREDFNRLKDIGCVLVDTTCGSVLVVWKRVESYARDGFTSVIHGKYTHEEARATASQVNKHPGGKYLIVRDMEEAQIVCDYIAKRPGHLSRDEFHAHFKDKATEGLDPDGALEKIGVANQTTMLANESLAIGAAIRGAFVEAYGEEHAEEHYRSFGTICSATQERQDAVVEMMRDPPDVMLVIGGYNSSNTNHLAHICRGHTRTYHIEDAMCIDVDAGTIRHKPVLNPHAQEVMENDWLPSGPLQVGITAGASTPNNKIGEAVQRLLKVRGIEPPELGAGVN